MCLRNWNARSSLQPFRWHLGRIVAFFLLGEGLWAPQSLPPGSSGRIPAESVCGDRICLGSGSSHDQWQLVVSGVPLSW